MRVDLFLEKLKSKIKANSKDVISLRNERKIKGDLSFVTSGDLFMNNIIEQVVREESEKIVVISEESFKTDTYDANGYTVVVDPIDGTENFTSGLPEWGVSVACFHKGMHIGSLLGCPEMDLWLKSGEPVTRFESRIRGLSSSLNKDEIIRATQGYEYRILGCCVYNMINVIRGSFVSFENPKGAHSWDILGGLNIALEHNLKVIVNDQKYSGEYLSADKKYRFWIGA